VKEDAMMRCVSFTNFVRCANGVLTLMLLAGCAGLEQGPLKPTDKTAVVKAGPWGKVYRGGYVEIASVNGTETGWRLRSEMELNAGNQSGVFYVYLCTQGNKHCTSVAEAQIRFKAEAGHTYQVRAREQVNGSNRFWVWVVDEGDNHVVGGTTPDTSS
jgi:hypothetical protein